MGRQKRRRLMPPKREDDFNKLAYHEILVELLALRETDYDGFMQKLYEALNGEFRDMVNDDSPIGEKKKALWTMLEHFEDREEYEKCANLKRMLDELTP